MFQLTCGFFDHSSRFVSTLLQVCFDRARGMFRRCTSQVLTVARGMFPPYSGYVSTVYKVYFDCRSRYVSTVIKIFFDRARSLVRP